MREGVKKITFEKLFQIPLRNGIYKSSEFQGYGIRIVNMAELFGYEFIDNQEMRLIDLNDVEKNKFLLKGGDLIFARRSIVEDGAGKVSFIRDTLDGELTFESSIIRVRLNRDIANPLFYYYYFKSEIGKKILSSISSGTNVKGIKGSDLKTRKIHSYPLPTQQKIARILSAYDDLIENNLRRIKLLEEKAQLTYEEWFVRMKFPGHETAAMDEETGLPEGWKKIKIGEISKVKGGKRLPKGHELISSRTKHPYIRVRDLTLEGVDLSNLLFIKDETYDKIKRYTISSDEIYISNAGTIGLVGIIPKRISGANLTENCAKVTDFIKDNIKEFICHFLKSIKGQYHLEARTGGASQPKLALYRIAAIPLDLPSDKILSEFNIISSDIRKLINDIKHQNQLLKEARDLLLPRLMTGVIDVDGLSGE